MCSWLKASQEDPVSELSPRQRRNGKREMCKHTTNQTSETHILFLIHMYNGEHVHRGF